jgi:hypothetical protein
MCEVILSQLIQNIFFCATLNSLLMLLLWIFLSFPFFLNKIWISKHTKIKCDKDMSSFMQGCKLENWYFWKWKMNVWTWRHQKFITTCTIICTISLHTRMQNFHCHLLHACRCLCWAFVERNKVLFHKIHSKKLILELKCRAWININHVYECDRTAAAVATALHLKIPQLRI